MKTLMSLKVISNFLFCVVLLGFFNTSVQASSAMSAYQEDEVSMSVGQIKSDQHLEELLHDAYYPVHVPTCFSKSASGHRYWATAPNYEWAAQKALNFCYLSGHRYCVITHCH